MDKKEKTLKENLVFDGKIIKVYCDDVLCPNGNEAKREYLKHNGGACILPVLDGCICFEKQYRYAYKNELLELPAGKLEIGELPIDAVRRELKEEIGLESKEIIEMGYMYPSCGYSAEIIYLFYSPENYLSKTNPDEDEIIDLVKIPIKEAYSMLDNNLIHDAKTVILLEKCRKYLLK